DRALFLEALLSEREVFYLSYIGQSLRDNQPLPRSVLASELLDYIAENFDVAIDQFVIKHPLQAFSPRNFQNNGRLFSYSADNRAAGIVPESALASVRASGVLPPGGTGGVIFDELCTNVTPFADTIRQQMAVQAQPATIIRADIGDFTLSGRIDRVRGDTLLHYRLTRL